MWHAMPNKKDMEKDKIIGKTKDSIDSIEKGETKEEDGGRQDEQEKEFRRCRRDKKKEVQEGK